MSYEDQLRPLGLCSLERRRLKRDFISLLSFLSTGSREGGVDFFSLVPRDRTHENGSNLYPVKFQLDMKIYFLNKKVIQHWNRLVDTPTKSALAFDQSWNCQSVALDDHCWSLTTENILPSPTIPYHLLPSLIFLSSLSSLWFEPKYRVFHGYSW